VVATSRRIEQVEETAAALEAKGRRTVRATSDVTSKASLEALLAKTLEKLGKVDILVNSAGAIKRVPTLEMEDSTWDSIIATNLTAPFLVSQAVLPAMIEKRRGKIIHISSLMSDLARPSVVPYTAAKGGVRQLTRGMAVELAPHNIQVNAIAPGYFATEMNRALLDDVEFDAWVRRRTPAGRWGRPDEIGGLAVFLASSAADYITGQNILIDGGMSVAL